VRTYIVERVLQLGETVHGGLESAISVLKKVVIMLQLILSCCGWLDLYFVFRLFC